MLISPQKEMAERQKRLAEQRKETTERQKELEERKKKLAGLENELSELERAYQQGNFQFFVVCGPEASGKTTLIKEFCGWKRRIFFKASGKDTVTFQDFTETLLKHYDKPRTESFSVWDSAFKFIADNEHGKGRMAQRLVLVLNEFPDLSRRDDQFMMMFKNAIEQHLSRTKIFLIVSSSDKEFVQKYFLDDNALLHNNMNGCIQLEHIALDDDAADKIADDAAKTIKGISNARMKMQKVAADEVILSEGDTNDAMYKIISGRAVCWFNYGSDEEYVLASMSEGECFGEYSLLTGEPSIYTVVAFSDMLLMKITKEDLVTFVELNAKNAIDIMENTARMLNVMAMNINMLRLERS